MSLCSKATDYVSMVQAHTINQAALLLLEGARYEKTRLLRKPRFFISFKCVYSLGLVNLTRSKHCLFKFGMMNTVREIVGFQTESRPRPVMHTTLAALLHNTVSRIELYAGQP